MDESLALAYIHPGSVDAHFMQSVLGVMAADHHRQVPRINENGGVIAIGSGPRIAEARNQAVSQFLFSLPAKPQWLLMIDTDMMFSPQALETIMDAADPEQFPIVGGLCFGGGRSGIMFPTMYRLVKVENINESPVQVIEEYPQDAMCEVDATGAAFLLIHRGVLEKMGETYRDSPYPWFLEGSVYKGTKFGEDWAFPVDAATPVLGADWRWRDLGSFVPGESVLGFDEYSPPHSSRRFQHAQVTDLIEKRLPRLRVVTTEGEIITTPEHPWLARPDNRYPDKTRWDWTPAGQLQPGMTVASVVSRADNPDLGSVEYAGGYLQGLLTSDGTRMERNGHPSFVVRMKDPEPLERAATMCALLGIESVRGEVRWDGNDRHEPLHRWGVYRQSSAIVADHIYRSDLSSREFASGYLAGMYDGDGHHDGGSLTISSVVDARKDKMEKAARMIGTPFTSRDARVVRMSSQASIFRFWQQTLPSLSRRTGVVGQKGNDGVRRGKEVIHRPVTVLAVEKMPAGDVACLTTSSGTFVAGGLASHNCMRAKEAGYKIHVHTGVKIGHVKPQVLDEDAWLAFKAKKAEVGEAGVAQAFKAKIMGGAKAEKAPTYVIVPQKGKVHMTHNLVTALHKQGDCAGVFVFDNGSSQPDVSATRKVLKQTNGELVDATGLTIHQMWNEGVRLIRKETDGPVNICVLNNDLRIGPHFILRQATALRADDTLLAVCPNYDQRRGTGVHYVKGTWGMGGMSGFAFMFKGEHFEGDPFDEGFKWWYGDDDFALRILDIGGNVGFVYGASVEHLGGGSQTAKEMPMDEICLADREYFKTKHGFIERGDGALVKKKEAA